MTYTLTQAQQAAYMHEEVGTIPQLGQRFECRSANSAKHTFPDGSILLHTWWAGDLQGHVRAFEGLV